ncbi:MAG: class I SAM-dependent RNA methyltransferase [Planctomycetota bacterium]
MPTFEAFAACLPGLEPLLEGELRALELSPRAVPGGVEFRADVAAVMRACLWLGTASHVRIRLATFRCRALGELERKARELPFAEWLSPRAPLHLQATARRSRVYHTGAIEQRVHDAIRAALGKAPPEAKADAAGERDGAHLQVRFDEDLCTLSLDATTTPLHRRGYRLDGRKAPLREDLAHALLLSAAHQPDEALLDPFCGSGTIVIEAAARALGMPPGRLRPPPLEQTPLFDAELWQSIFRGWEPRSSCAPIAASDRDEGAVQATQANAARAGVAAHLTCTASALAAQPWLQPGAAPPRGVVVTNPPFGHRVGQMQSLAPLYQTLGHRFAKLGDGWRACVLAHDVRLARRTGVPLHAAWTTRHGGLSITALCSGTTAAASEGGN